MIKRPKFIKLTIVFITALMEVLGISTLEDLLHTTTFQMERLEISLLVKQLFSAQQDNHFTSMTKSCILQWMSIPTTLKELLFETMHRVSTQIVINRRLITSLMQLLIQHVGQKLVQTAIHMMWDTRCMEDQLASIPAWVMVDLFIQTMIAIKIGHLSH